MGDAAGDVGAAAAEDVQAAGITTARRRDAGDHHSLKGSTTVRVPGRISVPVCGREAGPRKARFVGNSRLGVLPHCGCPLFARALPLSC